MKIKDIVFAILSFGALIVSISMNITAERSLVAAEKSLIAAEKSLRELAISNNLNREIYHEKQNNIFVADFEDGHMENMKIIPSNKDVYLLNGVISFPSSIYGHYEYIYSNGTINNIKHISESIGEFIKSKVINNNFNSICRIPININYTCIVNNRFKHSTSYYYIEVKYIIFTRHNERSVNLEYVCLGPIPKEGPPRTMTGKEIIAELDSMFASKVFSLNEVPTLPAIPPIRPAPQAE